MKTDQINPKPSELAKTTLLTGTAMLAFAANSLLCRLALQEELIDAASFSSCRVIAGALTLALIVSLRGRGTALLNADRRSVAALFIYMAFFSFSYLSLSAGTGALILFGAVQLTMFIASLRAGEQFSGISWLGFSLATLGVIYLMLPGVTAPDPLGAILMGIAGIAWGIYSLYGKTVADPLQATAANFVCTVPLVVIVSLFFLGDLHLSAGGLALAVASGAIASGLGYVAWYAALRGLSGTRAATVQLSVPVIAAFGGVIFLSEDITVRLIFASALTLGGVAIVLAQRSTALNQTNRSV